MPILHLGVLDVPHGGEKESLSTGDVAEILEEKYHIMEIFYEQHVEDVIVPALEENLQGQFERMLSGGGDSGFTETEGESKIRSGARQEGFEKSMVVGVTDSIKKAFDDFITLNEMDALGYPGIPTAASGRSTLRKGGVQHRFVHPYAKANPSRPSFVDTGAYLDSFTAWIDEEKK